MPCIFSIYICSCMTSITKHTVSVSPVRSRNCLQSPTRVTLYLQSAPSLESGVSYRCVDIQHNSTLCNTDGHMFQGFYYCTYENSIYGHASSTGGYSRHEPEKQDGDEACLYRHLSSRGVFISEPETLTFKVHEQPYTFYAVLVVDLRVRFGYVVSLSASYSSNEFKTLCSKSSISKNIDSQTLGK
jgi:hypothetical protein